MTTSRRRLLGLLGAGLGAVTAGCGGEDPPPGLYATRTRVVHQPGDRRYDYPEDVGIQVTVENTTADRKRSTLEVTLQRVSGGDPTPSVVESWGQDREIDLAGAATRSYFFVFEGVFQTGDEEESFRARARI